MNDNVPSLTRLPSIVRSPSIQTVDSAAIFTLTSCKISCVKVKNSFVVKLRVSVNPEEPRKSPVKAPPCCSNVTPSPAPSRSTEKTPPSIVPALTKVFPTAATATFSVTVFPPSGTFAAFAASRSALTTVIEVLDTLNPT